MAGKPQSQIKPAVFPAMTPLAICAPRPGALSAGYEQNSGWIIVRVLSVLLASFLLLAACDTGYQTQGTGTSASGLSTSIYRIRSGQESKIQYRMLDSINVLRKAAGAPPVQLNAQLNAAAATHSRDMSVQNRPWHFGSDGSSPLDRVKRAGYPGAMLGENISETYETELETLAAWMEETGTRSVILEKNARDMGFSWFQEPNGKIWWTLVMGG